MKTEFKKIKSFTTEEKFLAELCQKHNLQPDQFTADHTSKTFVFSTTAIDAAGTNKIAIKEVLDPTGNNKTTYAIAKNVQPDETAALHQIIAEKETFEGNLLPLHTDKSWRFQKIR